MLTPRFLTDNSLALVARRLRALGFDVDVARGARLEDLFAAALASGATVLTLSGRRPGWRTRVPVITLPRGDPAKAVHELASRFAPGGPPFGRCLECNTPLQTRFAAEARGEVPAGVARQGGTLRYCPNCARWYWEGSHTARLREWLEAALGRPLAERGESR
ncbi:MAG: Mut7-C RNAse domain-containing protein [Candidatus Eiseniibacteriota bacterium]